MISAFCRSKVIKYLTPRDWILDEEDSEGIVVSSAADALQTPPQPPKSTSLYVNSDEIRSRGVARSFAAGGESSVANQEILLGLGPDTDSKYHGTLTSILPIF